MWFLLEGKYALLVGVEESPSGSVLPACLFLSFSEEELGLNLRKVMPQGHVWTLPETMDRQAALSSPSSSPCLHLHVIPLVPNRQMPGFQNPWHVSFLSLGYPLSPHAWVSSFCLTQTTADIIKTLPNKAENARLKNPRSMGSRSVNPGPGAFK